MQPTEKEIDAVLDECAEYFGSSKFPRNDLRRGCRSRDSLDAW